MTGVTICGHYYADLPASLCACPECKRGSLSWDGRAWRCDSTPTTSTVGGTTRHCRYGVAMGAVFEGDDSLFSLRRVTLRHLPLTRYGHTLIRTGILSLPWTPPPSTPESPEAQAWATAEAEVVMRQPPGPTYSIKARRLA